jgi:hypothetical protein
VVSFTHLPLYPGTHSVGGWVGPRAGLDDVEKRIGSSSMTQKKNVKVSEGESPQASNYGRMLRPKVKTTPMCFLLLDIKGVAHYEFVPRQQ